MSPACTAAAVAAVAMLGRYGLLVLEVSREME
jgi:hypothetical protein